MIIFRQTHTNLVTQDVGTTINATNYIEGISPYWNEMIYVETSEDNSHTEGNEIITLMKTSRFFFSCRNYNSCY